MIGFVVISVEGFFANRKGGLDCEGIFVVDCSSGEVFVNVVHGWYDGGDAGRPSRKEEGCVFEDLISRVINTFQNH